MPLEIGEAVHIGVGMHHDALRIMLHGRANRDQRFLIADASRTLSEEDMPNCTALAATCWSPTI